MVVCRNRPQLRRGATHTLSLATRKKEFSVLLYKVFGGTDTVQLVSWCFESATRDYLRAEPPDKSQHRKLTLEEKILSLLLPRIQTRDLSITSPALYPLSYLDYN